jgi:glutathione-independent formaldehyde dehydrogenase
MKAVVYKGRLDVAVDDVPDATIQAPTDAVVRITTTNICGSDLHMYEGRTSVETGKGASASTTARCSPRASTWAPARHL